MRNPAATTENLEDEAGGGEDIKHTNRKESKKERSKNKDKKGKKPQSNRGKNPN